MARSRAKGGRSGDPGVGSCSPLMVAICSRASVRMSACTTSTGLGGSKYSRSSVFGGVANRIGDTRGASSGIGALDSLKVVESDGKAASRFP